MGKRLKKLAAHKILETAAGTGVVTAVIAKSLGAHDSLLATDLNPAMLQVAEKAISDPSIIFQQADATKLLFEDDRFDIDKINATLAEAGFTNMSCDVLPGRCKAPSARVSLLLWHTHAQRN